jgi:hypothetical protein
LRRAADVLVRQIAQHIFIFFAHAAREARIIQVPVARIFRHILQHAQPVLNRSLALRRHLFPLWQNVIANVLALRWGHPFPRARAIAKLLLLRGRQMPKLFFALR